MSGANLKLLPALSLQGGQMYEKLSFDKPETITKLGTKLFTRIENEDQQRVIREFLSEQSASADL